MQHEAVKFLLDAGASVTERDQMMDTCIHVAVKKGDVKTVKVLMEVTKQKCMIAYLAKFIKTPVK